MLKLKKQKGANTGFQTERDSEETGPVLHFEKSWKNRKSDGYGLWIGKRLKLHYNFNETM